MRINPRMSFDDEIGTEESEILPGTMGNDSLLGLGGNDLLLGSHGHDILDGGEGNDVVDGGAGDDAQRGGLGNDTMIALEGNDSLDGGAGSDVYIVAGGPAGDRISITDTDGRRDVLSAQGATTSVELDLRPGAISYVDGREIQLSGGAIVETALDLILTQDVSGSFGDDIATVQGLAETLVSAISDIAADVRLGVTSFADKPVDPFGSAGTDYEYQTDQALTSTFADFITALNGLTVRYGNDYQEAQLTALLQNSLRTDEIGWRPGATKVVVLTTDAAFHKAGDHPVAPNDGDAVLDGPSNDGTGEDFPSVDQVRAAVLAAGIVPIFAVTSSELETYRTLVRDLGVGAVVELSTDSSDIIDIFEDAIRTATTTLIEVGIGGRYDDILIGNSTGNELYGRLGDDSLKGLQGNDKLLGGGGRDSLVGDSGKDTLTGGAGRDRLTGGTEADVFVFAATSETGKTLKSRDVITDFRSGVDDIDLRGIDADTGTLGNQAFSFIGGSAFSGVAGQLRFAGGAVSGDVDGDGAADFQIGLTGVTSVVAGDFLL